MRFSAPIWLLGYCVLSASCGSVNDSRGQGDAESSSLWIALRFAGQQRGLAGMLVPLKGRRTVSLDDVFAEGIFCKNGAELECARQFVEGGNGNPSVLFQGALSYIEASGEFFDEYPKRPAKEPVAARHNGATCLSTLDTARLFKRARSMKITLIARKFNGQRQGTAGLVYYDILSGRLPSVDEIFESALFVESASALIPFISGGYSVSVNGSDSELPVFVNYSDADLANVMKR